jgi:hypothetical protein
MNKADYKQKLLEYIDKQLDKMTVKQLRVLLSSYVKS